MPLPALLLSLICVTGALILPDKSVADTPTQAHIVSEQQQWLDQTQPAALAVLNYWFEEWEADKQNGGKGRYNDKWFPHGPLGAAGSKAVDAEIRRRFLNTFEQVIAGKHKWNINNNPFDNLAYIILIDQFSRNMFRGQDRAYQYDHLARQAVTTNLTKNFSRFYFTGYQKLFVVYPLMHHEDLASQQASLQYLKQINEHSSHRYAFLNAMQKGVEHYQMIYMFGRFPHRNVRLNRPDTELETAYLAMKGSQGFVDGSKW